MPRILWVGNPYFSSHLPPLGWELRCLQPRTPRTYTWEQLLTEGQGAPDVLILGDNSMPPLLLGLERYPCLTAFYCVDSHIHSWHPDYAQAFDLCCLNLKDNLPHFAQRLDQGRLHWLPLWADAGQGAPEVPEQAKAYDLLFVGNVQPDIHPGRHAFFQRLKAACPGFTVLRGNYHQLFPQARIVFNYAERGDLNFRVFQALGTGACLLTPRVGHGQAELFQEGRELYCFDSTAPDQPEALAAQVRELLAAPELRQATARRGLAAVDAGHRAPHRAATLDRLLRDQDPGALIRARLDQAEAIHEQWLRRLYLHWAAILPDPLREEYFLHARRPTRPGV